MTKSSWPAFALFLTFLGSGLALVALRFPPLNSDEILAMNNGWNYWREGKIRYSLNDDLYPPAVSALAGLSNHIARPLYTAWAGSWTFLANRDYRIVRLSSIFLALLTLLLFFETGRRWQGPSLGWAMVLACALNPVFLASACVINEHPMLLTAAAGLLCFEARWPKMHRWLAFGLGTLSSTLFFIHQNGLVLWLGIVLFWLIHNPQRRQRDFLVGFITGSIVGTLLLLQLVDMPRMLLFQRAVYWQFAEPPILQWPWHPLRWLQSTFTSLFVGDTYYFSSGIALPTGWKTSQLFYWLAFVLGFSALRFKRRQTLSAFSGVLAIILLMTFIIRRQEAFYSLALLPLAVPAAALAWTQSGRRWRSLILVPALLSFISLLDFGTRYLKTTRSWSEIVAATKQRLPPGPHKIAGANILWPAFEPTAFRDIGATVTARYFVEATVPDLLGGWKPDILITEGSFQRSYGLKKADAQNLSRQLGIAVKHLGDVDTGSVYGVLQIYQLSWPS